MVNNRRSACTKTTSNLTSPTLEWDLLEPLVLLITLLLQLLQRRQVLLLLSFNCGPGQPMRGNWGSYLAQDGSSMLILEESALERWRGGGGGVGRGGEG